MADLLMEKSVEQYLRQVEHALVAPRAHPAGQKKSHPGAQTHKQDTTPGADLDVHRAHFVTPQKIADETLAALPPATLRGYVRRHAWARALLILLVVVILGAGLTWAIERIFYAANGNPIVIIEKPEIVSSIPESAANDTGWVWEKEP